VEICRWASDPAGEAAEFGAVVTQCRIGIDTVEIRGEAPVAERAVKGGAGATGPKPLETPEDGLAVRGSAMGSSGTCRRGTDLRCLSISARSSCPAMRNNRWCPNFGAMSGKSSSVSVKSTVPLMAWVCSSSSKSAGTGEICEIHAATSCSSHSSTGFPKRLRLGPRRMAALLTDLAGVMATKEEPADEHIDSFTRSLPWEGIGVGADGSSTAQVGWLG